MSVITAFGPGDHPGVRHVFKMASSPSDTDSDFVLLVHERSESYSSRSLGVTKVVLLQPQYHKGLSSVCFSRDVTARRYHCKSKQEQSPVTVSTIAVPWKCVSDRDIRLLKA